MIKIKKSPMGRIIDIFKNFKEKVKRILQPKGLKVEVPPIEKEVTEEGEVVEKISEGKIEIKKEILVREIDIEEKTEHIEYILESEEKLEHERKKEAEKNRETMKLKIGVERRGTEINKDKKKIVGVRELDEKIEKEIEEMGNETFYFTNSNWRVFYRFISATDKKLDIITNRMSSETIEFLFNKLSSTVKTRIIVGHTPNNYDNIKQFIAERGLDVELYVCRRIHCKFCIRDDKTILLGSSNMVFSSLGNLQRRGNFEADIISEDVSVVKEASNLFETIWQEEKKYVPIYPDCRFLSSVSGIPSKIEELISKTEKELIIFSPNFADKELICAVRILNKNIEIKIVLNWPSKSNEKVKKALNIIRDGKTTDGRRLFSIRPRRQSIHAKIYVFDRKMAFISSLNLTQSSWGYMIETGLLTYDKDIIKRITKMIKSFDYKIPSSIEIKGDGGSGEPPEIIEIPDEKYLFLDHEGNKFLKKCGQLYDNFIREFGEEFPESIPKEPEEFKAPPTEIEVTEKPEEIETPPTEIKLTEKPEEIETPPTEIEVTEKPEEIETPPTEIAVTEKPEEIETSSTEEEITEEPKEVEIPLIPIPNNLINSAIKQKTAIVAGGGRGWRLGKGFSKEEIERIKKNRLASFNIYTDPKRKTCYEHNIQLIKKIGII